MTTPSRSFTAGSVYRFASPMLRAYSIMRGFGDKIITKAMRQPRSDVRSRSASAVIVTSG
jgi:hypothetical protein